MDPREELRQGNVQQALGQLKQDVRKAPRDGRLRTFLFQLFCITGEWDRALTQLTVAGNSTQRRRPWSKPTARSSAVRSCATRCSAASAPPTVLGDPGTWLPLLIEATRLLATGRATEAATLRDQAFDAAPLSGGSVNDTPCEWIADADPRLGPVCEAVIEGRYVWVPYERIKAIQFEPPADLRDQVWMPARFTWGNDGEVVGFIPSRYPGSAGSPDPAIALARRTEWLEEADGWQLPLGQRMLVSDTEETALLDIRSLVLVPATPGPA